MKKNILLVFITMLLFATTIIPVIPVSSEGEESFILDCGSLYVNGDIWNDGANIEVTVIGDDHQNVDIYYNNGYPQSFVTFEFDWTIENIGDALWQNDYGRVKVTPSWDEDPVKIDKDGGNHSNDITFDKYCSDGETVSFDLYAHYADLQGPLESDGDTATVSFTFHCDENTAPDKPDKPSGDQEVLISKYGNHPDYDTTEYRDYTTSSTDQDGNKVKIRFDWGDGDFSTWSSWKQSGESVLMTHGWSEEGTNWVRAKAKDYPTYWVGDFQDQKTSDWSERLKVVVKYWYKDYTYYSELSNYSLSPETFNSSVEPVIDEPAGLNASNVNYSGVFADTNGDGVNDTVFITRFYSGANVVSDWWECSVEYCPRTGSYFIDFNMDGETDPEEESSPVSEENIPLCTDGDPFD